MILYRNAVPWVYYAGINDSPRTGIAPAVLQTSPHTVLSMLKTPWGELNIPIACKQGSDITTRFGTEVFDIDRPYYNYQSVLAEWIGGQGTPQYVARMELPDMAKSNARVFLDVAEHSHPILERNIDGSYKTDGDGNNIETGAFADGYIFRLITTTIENDFDLGSGVILNTSTLVGKKVVREADGSLLDPANPTFTDTAGVMYPFMDTQGRYFGELGDRILTELFTPLDHYAQAAKTSVIEDTGVMMYRLGHRLQARSGGGNTQIYGVSGDTNMDFALKGDLLNSAGTEISFDPVYANTYELSEQIYTGANLKAPCSMFLYEETIELLQGKFHAAELAAKALDVDYPCWIDETETYSINLIEGNDHYGVAYHALRLVGVAEQPADGQYSPYEDSFFKMAHGNDGDTSNTAYNAAVRDFAAQIQYKFPIWDMMQYQIGWVYDLGFEVATKKALYNIMNQNKALIVVNSTEEFGVDPKDRNDTLSTAIALQSGYGLYPESSIYKTEATRGVIVPYACKLKLHKYRKPLPLTFSLAKKMNDYLGYSTKIWNPDKDPMLERNKGIDEVVLNFESLNLNNRTNFWLTQLVIIDTIQHEVVGFSGLQTINGNDSSVLNNLLVIAATGQAVRAGYEAGVVFSGQTAPVAVIAKRHEDRIIEECAGIDVSKAIVTVKSHQTDDDYNAGYAITDTITVSGYQAITAVTLELNSQYAEG